MPCGDPAVVVGKMLATIIRIAKSHINATVFCSTDWLDIRFVCIGICFLRQQRRRFAACCFSHIIPAIWFLDTWYLIHDTWYLIPLPKRDGCLGNISCICMCTPMSSMSLLLLYMRSSRRPEAPHTQTHAQKHRELRRIAWSQALRIQNWYHNCFAHLYNISGLHILGAWLFWLCCSASTLLHVRPESVVLFIHNVESLFQYLRNSFSARPCATERAKYKIIGKQMVDKFSQGHAQRTIYKCLVEQREKPLWVQVARKTMFKRVRISTMFASNGAACIVLWSSECMVIRRDTAEDRLQTADPWSHLPLAISCGTFRWACSG